MKTKYEKRLGAFQRLVKQYHRCFPENKKFRVRIEISHLYEILFNVPMTEERFQELINE